MFHIGGQLNLRHFSALHWAVKLLAKSESGQHYTFVRMLIRPAKLLNWGLFFGEDPKQGVIA
jgi:hypothetical protein